MNYDDQLTILEQEHIKYQLDAWMHFKVHWKMFMLASKHGDWKEVLGQVPRLILAMPGSWSGKAPRGNVGSTKMGIFEVKE